MWLRCDRKTAREGAHLLDVGCGNGEDTRALAEIAGRSGGAVGVDRSETMIAEARKRSEGLTLLFEPYKKGGLTDIVISASPFFSTDYAIAMQVYNLKAKAESARDAGVVPTS